MRFQYVFAPDRTGSLSVVDGRHHATVMGTFTYALSSDGEYVLKRAGPYLVRDNVDIRGRVLEDRGYAYWHEGGWTAPSGQNHYTCIRSLPSGS